jgi:predicted nucleic acid-binding protein
LSNLYFLDACSIIAVLADEKGAENVLRIIQDAIAGKAVLKINQVNLLEVYYYLCRAYGQEEANKAINKIKEYPIEIIIGMKETVFNEAGRIKPKYKIPLGDSIAIAECIINNGTLVTSDHDDFAIFEKEGLANIYWFR